jgi:S-DNA-T family DNA segregation ATPase FtsK/SpoIIIE
MPMSEPDEPVPVDQEPDHKVTAFTRITAHREGSKKPIIVDWIRDPGQLLPILRWALGYAWHITWYQAIRMPLYALKLASRSHVGAWRVLRQLAGWLRHDESRELRNEAALHETKRNEAAYRALKAVQMKELERRRKWAWLLTIPALAVVVAVWFWVPGWTFWPGVAAAVEILGFVGRKPEVRLTSKATVPAHLAPVLRMDAVELALRSLACIPKGAAIEFPDPIIRDGPGWLARVNLPLGVTPSMVNAKRAELASGLRRPLGCVWPESGAEEHGGLLKLWVGFEDMAVARQPAWPLLKGEADLFRPIPYGTDKRARKVGVNLFEKNVLIGGIPGSGKTTSVLTLLLAAALDVTAELHTWELKGSGDLASVEGVSHRYGSGMDDETVAACVADLREILADLEKRAATVSRLAKVSPELFSNGRKTSRRLANRRDLGLHPVVFTIDECQNLFSHETYGADAKRLCLSIVRMGRAFGVILILATQRPDADALPTGIAGVVGVRICLRVKDSRGNNAILGEGAYSSGVNAMLFKGERNRGVGYIDDDTDEPVVAKAYNTVPIAAQVGARARKLREEAGRLTGYAAGVLDDDPNDSLIYDLLADVKRVISEADRDWMHSEEIVRGLAELREGHYGGWSPETLAKNLTPRGVKTDQINRVCPDGVRRNLRGVELSHVARAIAARNGDNVVPLHVAGPPATGNTAV